MCEFCEKEENLVLQTYCGVIKIKKQAFSPTGYQLISDNSGGEYGESVANISFCPMCGRKLCHE